MRFLMLGRWRHHRNGPTILADSTWFRIEHRPDAPARNEVVVVFTKIDHHLPPMTAGDADELGEALMHAGRCLLETYRIGLRGGR